MPDQVEAERATRAKEHDEDADIAADALEWCSAMQTVFEENRLWRAFEGFRMVAYGFLDEETEGGGLGIIVYTAGDRSGQDERISITVGDEEFPILVRKGWRWIGANAQATILDPFGGTTTAWARRTIKNDNWMLLTAAHVASRDLTGIQIGDAIQLSDGSVAHIKDVGPPAIDAMLLELETDPGDLGIGPANQPVSIENLVAPYSDVTIEGATSGAVKTKVMSVTDTRGTLNPYLPIRLFLADPCQPGDSGALTSLSDGRAIGIYTAALGHPQQGHPPEGLCQHLGQVAYCMSLEMRHL